MEKLSNFHTWGNYDSWVDSRDTRVCWHTWGTWELSQRQEPAVTRMWPVMFDVIIIDRTQDLVLTPTKGKLCKYKENIQFSVQLSFFQGTQICSRFSPIYLQCMSVSMSVSMRKSLHYFFRQYAWKWYWSGVLESFGNVQEEIFDKWMWHCWWLMMSKWRPEL